MSKINPKIPRLEWPEFDHSNEREIFYASLLSLLGQAKWIVVIPNPAPLGSIRKNIEADCGGLLFPLEMPHDGVAWLIKWDDAMKVFPGIFHARRPELIFLSFLEKPDLLVLSQALRNDDPTPALRRIHFDEGEMVQVHQSKGQST
ncbi:hypothetical protein DWB84_18950 [Saccharophagus sp. K07]|jgi:hypothetical protein|uniref:hypothetical protein n=1 Tax=Saccharophagus sp. K07 TaxID=2283636 RepID=UPI001652225E|nr:hypothetical protein [Saccharophagus sp. K07]MBC6907518.1 hypothetical protein [Saccharophagus sp. K07]